MIEWVFAAAILISPGNFHYVESVPYPTRLLCQMARRRFLDSVARGDHKHVTPCEPKENPK